MRSNRVLLVEDNPDDEALALDALRSEGVRCPIDVVHDGAEALDYLFGRGAFAGEPVDPALILVLLDLKLPKRNGFEVLAEIRAHPTTRYVPVIVLTSSNEQEDIVRSYGSGANSFVRKPIDFAQFTAAVKALGRYWLLHNEVPR